MKTNIKNSLSILLNFVIIYFSFEIIKQKTIQSETLVWSTWSYSELLINYPQQIFVRRGLLGEIFQMLANEGPSYKIVQQFVFYNFLVFMILSTTLLVLYGLKQYQISYFLISSFGFLNLVSYDLIYHRKEIVIFNLFFILLFILRLKRIKLVQYLIILYLSLSTIAIALIHEGMLIIFIPFVYIFLKRSKVFLFRKNLSIANYYLGLVSVLIFAVVINKGDPSISLLIFESLHPFDRSLLENYSVDGIRAIGWSLKRGLILPLRILLSGNAFYWLYIFVLMFFSVYIICIKLSTADYLDYLKKLHIENPILALSYTIFLIGWDWGRWFIVIFYLYLFLIASEKQETKTDPEFKQSLWLIIFFIVLSVGTIIPECCLAWTDPKILNNLERYIGEIKVNY